MKNILKAVRRESELVFYVLCAVLVVVVVLMQ